MGGVSFYERQEVKDVLSYLNLMANPKDDLAFARIVNVPPRGLGKTSLDHLVEAARQRRIPLLAMARQAGQVEGLKDKATRGLLEFTRLIDELAALRDHPAEEVIRQLLERTGYRDLPGRGVARQRRGSPGEPGRIDLGGPRVRPGASRGLDPRLPGRSHPGLAHRPLGPANRRRDIDDAARRQGSGISGRLRRRARGGLAPPLACQ